MNDWLQAPHTVAFSYRRSVGGAVGRFLSGLAEKEIWGSRAPDGTVEVPPVDWDPVTGRPVDDLVRVADVGTVRSWTWVADPPADGPAERPHALALVELDGADTSLLHVVDVPGESHLRTGMRVRADWRDERAGSVLDIRAFVPVDAAGDWRPPPPPAGTGAPPELATDLEVAADVELRSVYQPGHLLSRFLVGLAGRRIEGGRCPACGGVYVPPRPRCPACRAGPLEPVGLGDRGTVDSCTVVHLPVAGSPLDPPIVIAWIRLDGADVPFAHLLGEIAPDDVAVGQRVEAMWVPDADLAPTWESIRYFRPCDHAGGGSGNTGPGGTLGDAGGERAGGGR